MFQWDLFALELNPEHLNGCCYIGFLIKRQSREIAKVHWKRMHFVVL